MQMSPVTILEQQRALSWERTLSGCLIERSIVGKLVVDLAKHPGALTMPKRRFILVELAAGGNLLVGVHC